MEIVKGVVAAYKLIIELIVRACRWQEGISIGDEYIENSHHLKVLRHISQWS